MECKGYRSRHWTPISDPDDPGNVHPPSIYVVLNWAEELGRQATPRAKLALENCQPLTGIRPAREAPVPRE